ncbi:MAG TPA: mechanosensitive ion channel family protein [Vicinamibacterales bacterium]|nr:mechanosensitive ion channel family protein [Vicinamibacterales bacterium]
MPHSTAHLLDSVGLLLGAALFIAIVRNRVIRRRLLFSAAITIVTLVLHLAAEWRPDIGWLRDYGWRLEEIGLSLSFFNTLLSLAFNPWFRDGTHDRTPAIVQDTLVILVVAAIGIIAFDMSSISVLAGSTIVAGFVGFAAQSTLSNAFAGIAIQIERPFRVGHWVTVGNWVGTVTEITWRATKIRTKEGNIVDLPNSVLAGEAITNYSEPDAPSMLYVDVGLGYEVAPDDAREALMEALGQAKYVLSEPAPDVLLLKFGDSAVVYRARFWIDDFSQDDLAQDAVHTRIYYELRRRNIEIPWPIQIEYSREEPPVDTPERRERFARQVAAVPVFAKLPPEAHRALAAEARELLYGDGEVIVREGDAGASLFAVVAGRVAITVGPDRREVAVTRAGGYFGEMSLLTGDPRTATVTARGSCTVLEITAESFRAYVQQHPEVIDALAAAAQTRRKELDDARAAPGGASQLATASLRARMLDYFGLR